MPPTSGPRPFDVICFSHLRWHFVFQRPQHLMTRCARDGSVFFVEEAILAPIDAPRLHLERSGRVTVVVPHLPEGLSHAEAEEAQRRLITSFVRRHATAEYVVWFYTPMALPLARDLTPLAIVYDCMDELSAFKNAPPDLADREAELMRRASVVFTGGHTLYEAKRHQHPNIHPFPSSVDVEHFAQARRMAVEPPDQRPIARPRLGFFGVIDERMDIALVDGVAAARPDWQIVMLGPVVKIDPASLPRRPNIHYLGPKKYEELPQYVAGWDVALLPFARNDATRFISPTKTPEYLAAGRPVVSTSIRDVVRPYGQQGLVRIADDAPAFTRACVAAMAEDASKRITQADAFLRQTSWDGTWSRMRRLVDNAIASAEQEASADAAAGGTAV